MDQKKPLYDLSRRKLLAGLGTVGLASAGAGLGTTAYFNDTESFEGNHLTAGELNLQIGWKGQYNSASDFMAPWEPNAGTVDGEPGMLTWLDDVKPGDHGHAELCFKIVDNPAYLWICGELTSNAENGQPEPETVVDPTGGDPGEGVGELADEMMAYVSYTDGSYSASASDDGSVSYVNGRGDIASGTLKEVLTALSAGLPLDANDTGGVVPGEQACFEGSAADEGMANTYVTLEFEVPTDVGNEIQTDSVEFDIQVYAQQCRHNDGTHNPCADHAECEPCTLSSGVEPSPEVSVLSTDASEFPDISTFVQVNTTAGTNGDLTAADFTLCESGLAQNIDVTFQSNRKADIVFVFDDTGSMGEEIQGAKDAINAFVTNIDASLDARYALLSYKDSVEVNQSFTGDQSAIAAAVNGLSPSGGGEFREDNFDALAIATGNSGLVTQETSPAPTLSAYRSGAQRVIIDITDAPAHTENTIESSGTPTGKVTDFNMSEVAAILDGYTYIAVSEPVPPGGDEESYATGDKQALASLVGGKWFDLPQSSSDEFSTFLIDEVGGLLVTTYEITYTTCDAESSGEDREIVIQVDDPDEGLLYGLMTYTAPV